MTKYFLKFFDKNSQFNMCLIRFYFKSSVLTVRHQLKRVWYSFLIFFLTKNETVYLKENKSLECINFVNIINQFNSLDLDFEIYKKFN